MLSTSLPSDVMEYSLCPVRVRLEYLTHGSDKLRFLPLPVVMLDVRDIGEHVSELDIH
jgi:hypothetical protein